LAFDIFGTVVDWRTSLIAELFAIGDAHGVTNVDWASFADDWRAAYQPSMQEVREAGRPWTSLDDLHRISLDRLLERYGVAAFDEPTRRHVNRVWHRLRPWSDSVEGIRRLRTRFIVASLSNGNVALLANLARHAGLPFDLILSAELCRHYKPDPEIYRMAIDLLALEPQQVMMVAAHNGDLVAAAAQGMRTAFVRRPSEHGPRQMHDLRAGHPFDIVAEGIGDLADRLLAGGSS